jgi:uncharacterized protein with HEPN domain
MKMDRACVLQTREHIRRPAVDWRLLAAFRNVLVHDYLGVDLEQIWWIVQNNVPGLKAAAEAMLGHLDPQG